MESDHTESISAPHWGQSRLTTNVTKKRGVRQNIFAGTSLDNFCTNDMYSEENQSLPSISRISSLGWLERNAGYCNHTTPQSRSWKRGSAGRRRLVSPTAGAPARRHWGAWRTASASRFFLHLAVLLFASTSLCCAYTAKEKTPLITNNDQNSDFRYFMKPSGEETPMERSIAAAANVADAGDTLHFQTLKHIKEWGNTTDVLLVSGRDYVYMLDSALSHNPSKITYLERLAWPTGDTIRKDCHLMAIKEFECENFIRVVEVVENNELMVCGTNAYSPACRYYKREQFNQPPHVKESAFRYESMCRGHCVVPYNPATASATLYTDTDNGHQLFTAVVNDFHGNDPTILRKDKPTLSSNSHWLNDPTFIKMLEYKDKVYVFFREIAKESESGESEKVTYARVAQVCKNDQGGVNVLAHQWTSFLKARLRCGYSKRRNMNFDNMTSVSDIVNGTKDLVFATFTTPWEWTDAPMSAVCAFSMEDIIHVFEKGSFLEEYELDATPLQKPEMPSMGGPSFSAQTSMKKIRRSYAVPQDKVPDMRPGSCLDTQSPNVFSFAKEHPLMYDVIEPQFGRPIFVSFNNIRATRVAVDADAGESGMLMIYVGSEEGKVLRMRGMLGANEGPKAALLESIMVGDKERCEVEGCAIRSLHVSRPQNRSDTRPSVFVAFSDYMVQFPLARCGLYKNKECCSVDPECGWKGGKTESCVRRTSQNRHTLAGTSSDTDKLPESCDIAVGSTNGLNPCGCDGKNKRGAACQEDYQDDGMTVDPDLLARIETKPQSTMDLENILINSILPNVAKQYEDTLRSLHDRSQRNALRKQLQEAIISTTNLVLKNHRQEYCLPSPTVNQLTHVYPLLLREIEVWHETALKKMNRMEFDKKCWNKGLSKCHRRVSFSIPLVPVLWEPLTKLISDFMGECETIVPPGVQPDDCRHESTSRCASLPGMDTCRDARQPHCHPRRCKFPKYAVDVKAFFRHANDSRRFLEYGGSIEPLWKPVNVTIPDAESVRGHLELVVAHHMPFVIDYSPVAEKVKIMFHYTAVRDCALTEPMCVGTNHGCNPDVERVIDHWFRWTMDRMSHKLRNCDREIGKARKADARERLKRERREGLDGRHAEVADRSELFMRPRNEIPPITPDRCKRVSGKIRANPSQPISRNLWSLIVSRCQRAGGEYSAFHGSIEFYDLSDVIRFFKNMCTFEEPSIERNTFRRRSRRGRSGASVVVKAMVTREAPFIIQRVHSSGRMIIKYFTMEAPLI